MGAGSVDLLDWRRRTAALYAGVRSLAATDPAAAHGLWRAERDAMVAEHPASALAPEDPRRTSGLPCAPYDPALRFTAAIDPAPASAFTAVTGTDGEVGYERLGTVALDGLGTLDVWWLTGYGGGVWVPVRDGGSGSVSYGGGRYLLDTVKGADLGPDPRGRAGTGDDPLVLDLNFLYPPSCAYDPEWACPLAPTGNRLDAVLTVGELEP